MPNPGGISILLSMKEMSSFYTEGDTITVSTFFGSLTEVSFIGLAVIGNLYRKMSNLSIKINNYVKPLTSSIGNASSASLISELVLTHSSLSLIVQKGDNVTQFNY